MIAHSRHILIGALLSTLALPALAGQDSKPASSDRLPGVEGEYSIVKPAPEPLEEPATADDGYFKMGDWDIRISGDVMYQIGASSSDSGQRRER